MSDETTKTPMQIGMVGLGRMGANMVRRLIKGGHQCVVFNRTPQKVKDLVKESAVGAVFARRPREETPEAAGSLVDGARRSRGQDHRRPAAAAGARRHPD